MILRSTLCAVPFVLLAACGGPDTGQANNAQANISNDSRPEMNNAMVLLTLSKDQLVAIQHERHEGMEAIGKATKAAGREFQGSGPDVTVVRQSAARINALANKASGWFPEGTGPELGNEVVCEDLSAAADERNLRPADGDPHAHSPGTRACCRVPPRPPTDSLGRKV